MAIFGSTPSEPPAYLMGVEIASLPKRLPQMKRGARRRITVVGEQILHRRCQDVTEFGTKALKSMLDDMFATMEVASGVGLAGNQAGIDLRMFVFDCQDADGVRHAGHVINPRIDETVKRGAALVEDTEGCLSVPGPHAALARADECVVRGVDLRGEPVVFRGTGLLARCFQHETDHCDGLLYIDHLDDDTRAAVLAEMEQSRDEVWASWDARAAQLGK